MAVEARGDRKSRIAQWLADQLEIAEHLHNERSLWRQCLAVARCKVQAAAHGAPERQWLAVKGACGMPRGRPYSKSFRFLWY